MPTSFQASFTFGLGSKSVTRMWANAQRHGRPAEYRCRLALCSTPQVWLTATTRVLCNNAAKTRNPLKLAGVPQTNEMISAASRLKFTIMWRRYCCLTSFFPIVDTCLSFEDVARQSCAMVSRWRIFGDFFTSCIFSEPRAARFRPAS